MSALRSLAKKLPYPLFLRAYYLLYRYRNLPAAEAARRRAGIPPLAECDLGAHKRSDVLFVLGGGTSINAIGAERWQAIAAHDSLGLNWWLVHPFVPTFYLLEVVTREAFPEGFDRYVEVANRRGEDYSATIKIAMELDKPGTQSIAHVSPAFRQNLYSACNLPAPARTEQEFAQALRYLTKHGRFRQESRFSILLKYAASLTTTLAFALKLGYKKVVLCGIDLTHQHYFYQDPQLYPEWTDFEYVPRQARHDTDVRLEWRIPVSRAIAIMQRELLEPAGIQLYIEHRGSALWPMLPEAPPSLFVPQLRQSSRKLALQQDAL
jgi:hypothetical protein